MQLAAASFGSPEMAIGDGGDAVKIDKADFKRIGELDTGRRPDADRLNGDGVHVVFEIKRCWLVGSIELHQSVLRPYESRQRPQLKRHCYQ